MFGKKTDEQAKFPKIWFIWNLVEALLILTAGVLSIVFGVMNDQSGSKPIETTIAAVIGAFIILDGILRIIMVLLRYKESEESVMLVGGFEITAGIVVIIFHTLFVQLIINFLSIFLMVIGALMLLFSILTIVRKADKMFMPVLEIIFGALLLALGVAVMILYKNANTGNQVVLIVIGVVMAAFGVTQAIIALISYRKKKKQIEALVPADEPSPERKPRRSRRRGDAEVITPQVEERPVAGELPLEEEPEPLQIEEKK